MSIDKEKIYNRALKIYNLKDVMLEDYERVIELLRQIEDYRDSKEIILDCEKKIDLLKKDSKHNGLKIALIVIFAVISFSSIFITKEIRYRQASRLFENEKYDAAALEFKKLGNYKDSKDLYYKTYTDEANRYFEEGEYEKVIDLLLPIYNYGTSTQLILKSYYELGMKKYAKKDHPAAIKYLKMAREYKDTSDTWTDIELDYIRTHSSKDDNILLSYLTSMMNYNKTKEEATKKYREVFGWTGTLELADTNGTPINNKTLPSEYTVLLKVDGGMPNEKQSFNWYEYDRNYNLVYQGTHCELKAGGKCKSSDKYSNRNKYGFAVYVGDLNDGYKVAEIKFR